MKDVLKWVCNFFTLMFTLSALVLGMATFLLSIICIITGKDIDGWLALTAFVGQIFIMQTALRIQQNKDFIVLPFPRIGL